MRLSWDEIQSNAVLFAKRWEKARREKADEQPFIIELLGVFGVEDPVKVGERQREVKVKGETTKWIDFFWKNKIAVEMKSKGEDLQKAYWQLKERYMDKIEPEDVPDLWLICDFENFHLFRVSTKTVSRFKLKDLRKNIRLFADIAGYETVRTMANQIQVNVKAAEKMARLYDALKDHGYDGHELEVYLVRLLFCLFAGDTGIFIKGDFHNYILASKEDGSDLSHRLFDLFEVLNMPPEIRAKKKLLSEELQKFAYVNGGLFEETLPKADFDAKTRKILLECRENFDWSTISPAIFGAMFQGVMDKAKRREAGAHYTSEENIEKLINPLFMDDLYNQFEKVKTNPVALDRFHEKIAGLKFLDPACGCGNFLIVTYTKLRELEHEILKMKIDTSQRVFDVSPMLRVSIEQFYGIEYEEFPCQIAQVGMWLAEHQMNMRLWDDFGDTYIRLPLTHSATIIHGNALRIDWEDVVPKEELSYILGNPPFLGYSNQSPEQKADMISVYVNENGLPFKTAGKIDYVAAWYYKAAKLMQGAQTKTAFVSTNSITQGEQVTAVWKPIFDMFGVHIDFGYRTFKWSNEAKGKAAVHCVIVGFSTVSNGEKTIFDGEEKIAANNISPYLIDAPDIFIESRKTPIGDVPAIVTGNRPADGGHLIIEDKDLQSFLDADPFSEKYIRPFMGAEEFINNKKRWCLWLVGVAPGELRKMPEVLKRISACRKDRENAPDAGRRKLAKTPMLFRETKNPEKFIVVPATSSENRLCIPIGYLDKKTIVSNAVLIIPESTLYHFGILTSDVHMAWTRTVCGRLKSDYRYSKDIVYNNFPWPQADEKQQSEIEKLAQAILDARANYPDSSLADLYDPLTMPPDLQKAHRNLDTAVMKLYGFPTKMSEAEIVAALMEMYQKLAKEVNT